MNTNNGWKLVPVVPTDEMEVAAENDYEQTGATFPRWKSAYAAMIAAVPAATGSPASTVADEGAKDEQAAADVKLGVHVREWAQRQGWKPEDAEGAWEFAQRISYEGGRRDATPYWAQAYEEQDNYDQDVASAIKRVAARIERASRAPAAGDARALAFVQEVAQQKPEKPDHWSSCGQCASNISQASDLLDEIAASQQGGE